MDNLNLLHKDIDFIYIPYHREYIDYHFEGILQNRYPKTNFKFLCLEENSRGAAETIYIALQKIRYVNCDKPILCIDADNFYKTDNRLGSPPI